MMSKMDTVVRYSLYGIETMASTHRIINAELSVVIRTPVVPPNGRGVFRSKQEYDAVLRKTEKEVEDRLFQEVFDKLPVRFQEWVKEKIEQEKN